MGGGSRVASQAKSAESKSAGSGSPWLRKSKLSQWSMKPHPALQSQAPWPEVCYLRTKRFGEKCDQEGAPTLAPAGTHRPRLGGGGGPHPPRASASPPKRSIKNRIAELERFVREAETSVG